MLDVRVFRYVCIKGRPVKIVDYSTSKTGKHGHAKAHIIGIDIFTQKKLEELCPTTHNMDVPNVTRTEYQVRGCERLVAVVSQLSQTPWGRLPGRQAGGQHCASAKPRYSLPLVDPATPCTCKRQNHYRAYATAILLAHKGHSNQGYPLPGVLIRAPLTKFFHLPCAKTHCAR